MNDNLSFKSYFISVPGSKSYTHRALLISSLCCSGSVIVGFCKCSDTNITCVSLKKLGIKVRISGENIFIKGFSSLDNFCKLPMYLGNSGTSMRFMLSFFAFLKISIVLVGDDGMYRRSIVSLVNGLKDIGFIIDSLKSYGYPPIRIKESRNLNNFVKIDCSKSSQYLSSFLLASSIINKGLKISLINKVVSRSYIDMTVSIMSDFGVLVDRKSYCYFSICGNNFYSGINYIVEPDCSNACFFFAIASLMGERVAIKNLSFESKQGDMKFLSILEKMGSLVYESNIGVIVLGRFLNSVIVDMRDLPDVIPIFSILASFSSGVSVVNGISHLMGKESNRIYAITKELRRMGVCVVNSVDKLIIKGGGGRPSFVKTYKDHRIAMSFALAFLRIPKIRIKDYGCVRKSFPSFWNVFVKFCGHSF